MIKFSTAIIRLTLISFAVMTLAACSEEPRRKFEGQVSLIIDQKKVLNEKVSQYEAFEKHKELLDVFDTACMVAYFFETKSGQNSLGTALNLAEIPTTDTILTCQSEWLADGSNPTDFSGCSIRPRGDGDIQKQYLLALRDFLKDRHKMVEGAVLTSISKESVNRRSREITKLYEVKGNALRCNDVIMESAIK